MTALRSWAGHRHAGIRIDPLPPIELGQTMVLVFPLGPLTLTAANRIIEVIDEPDRYGFTYATLPIIQKMARNRSSSSAPMTVQSDSRSRRFPGLPRLPAV